MHKHRSRLTVHNIVFKIAGASRAECRAVAEDELRFINRALTFKIFKLVQVITVRQRIGDADRVHLDDGGKRSRGGGHIVALRENCRADLARDRRGDTAVAEVDLGETQAGLSLRESGAALKKVRLGAVPLRGRDGAAVRGGHPSVIFVGLGERGPGLFKLRAAELHRRLIACGVYLEKRLSFPDHGTLLKIDAGDLAGYLRFDLHALNSLGAPHILRRPR